MIHEREAIPQPAVEPAGNAGPALLTDVLSVGGVLALQRAAGNAAVARAFLLRDVGWKGVDPQSWNAGPQEVKSGKGIRRVPVEGLKQGHRSPGGKQDDPREEVDDPETGVWGKVSDQTPEAAGGDSGGRAVVLIPNGLPDTAGAVEVLVHLHGFTPGLRGRGQQGRGAPEDVSVARIAQQLEASGRPMIAVMPQGTRSGGPFNAWKVDLNRYIDDALAMVPADQWPGKKARRRGSIVLSAHSGGGDVIAAMMRGGRMPADVAGIFLFDALHGWGPDEVARFLRARLDSELAHLHGIWTAKNGSATPEAIADEQTAWLLASGFRFRGFSSAKYAKTYTTKLRPQLEPWFTGHAAQLGGADSAVFRVLSANYLEQATVPAGEKHEPVVGQHLLESLSRLRGGTAPDLKGTTKVPAMPPAPKPGGATIRRKVGWAGAGKGSTNREPRTTAGTGIKRVPIRGVAAGRAGGNALVLIPNWLPEVKTVEVLFHLHGHEWPGYGFGYGSGQDETVYRFEQALDRFATTKRPIIAVLPQGGSRSEFGTDSGELDADTYIRQAIAEVPADQWPGGAAPGAGGVILSGHSGAGGRFADMFGTAKMPKRLEGFFSFDTINGKTGQKVSEIVSGNEYKQHVKFILARLDADLAMLAAERGRAAGKQEGEIQAALEGKLVREGFRFHAFYTEAPHVRGDGTLDPSATAVYADRYFLLKGHVDAWFDTHAAELGGKGSKAYAALRANYTIEPAGTEHMKMMGGLPGATKGDPWQHENMWTALGGLPTTPQL
ncbi:MAG TPA: hypothetical protein VFM58_03675 [Solirubrobacteraceae bacterium]|nr:hypothetical protein [Solirubrobacteraceae bacterium]